VTGSRSVRGSALAVGAGIVVLAATAHAEDSKLRILGAHGAAATVTRVSTTAAVQHTLVIQSQANESLTVAVDVGPLVDTKGISSEASAKLNGSADRSVEVPPLGAIPLSVTATLPVVGEYTSEITLSHAGTRQLARLVVNRTIEPLPVTVLALDPVRGEASTFGKSSAALEIALEETSGREIVLETFELVAFAIKAGTAKYQADATLELGTRAPRDPKTRQLVLATHKTLRVPIALGEIEGAGEYTGTIRIGAPGKKPVDQAFTLALRESRWTAFGFLFLGSVLAMLLQWATTELRPRLTIERRLAVVARQIKQRMRDPAGDDEEHKVLEQLSQAVEAQLEVMRSRTAANGDAAVVLLETRRELADAWIARHRQLKGIEPPEVRDEVGPVLEAARAEITSGVATAESLRARRQELEQLPGVAQRAVKQALKTRIDAMRTSVEAASVDPSRAMGPAMSAQVTPLLDEATRMLDKPDLAAPLRMYNEARKLWLVLLLDDLEAALAAPAPAGFDPPEWQAMVGSIAPDLEEARKRILDDPDAALRRYRSAQARYLAALASGLMRAIADAQDRIAASSRDPAVKAKLAAELTTAATDAAAARLAASTGKLDEAYPAIERAQMVLQRVKPVAKTLGDSVAEDRRSPLTIMGKVTDLRMVAGELSSFEPIASRTRWIDLISLAATMLGIVVAALVGLTMLWEPNHTWGGSGSYISAVLWGLGLHGATVSGANAVAEKLFGKRAESSP
jgi:hypothetical protein